MSKRPSGRPDSGAFEQSRILAGPRRMQRQQRGGSDIDGLQDRPGCHRRFRTGACDGYSTLRKIRLPFVPPNPNEFDSAARIGVRRATFGT